MRSIFQNSKRRSPEMTTLCGYRRASLVTWPLFKRAILRISTAQLAIAEWRRRQFLRLTLDQCTVFA